MFIKVNGCVTDEVYQGNRYFTVSDNFPQDNCVVSASVTQVTGLWLFSDVVYE